MGCTVIKSGKLFKKMEYMKIFLNGGGCGPQTDAVLKRFNEMIDRTKPLLYIPLAMERERYPGCYEWIQDELREVDVPRIEMVTSAGELARKDLDGYCAAFAGGGSAGAIIFGRSLESCAQDDKNDVGLKDLSGFDVLNGVSLLCHHTKHTEKKDRASTIYLTELSKQLPALALPEEDTIAINGDEMNVMGTGPYYCLQNGVRETREAVQ